MKIVLQRVARAEVRVGGRGVAAIGSGLLLLAGVAEGDGPEAAAALARKVAGLRVFEDPPGKMNLSVRETGGAVLAVPQFTLLADVRRGRRPDFAAAAPPAAARSVFECLCDELAHAGLRVERGIFGEHMEVELVNDGPVTLLLEA